VNRIKLLMLRHLRGELAEAERDELSRWLADSPENQALFEEMNNPVFVAAAMAKMDAMHEEEVWERVNAGREVLRPTPRRIGRFAAAAVVLLLAGGYWWWQAERGRPAPVAQAPITHDVAPGSNKAVLTLSNGARIVLDSAQNGALAQQGGTRVIKTDSGRIAYHSLNEKATATLYNTLATPRGGQYQLTLPDGTKVWLNAASSIRYPVLFSGPERRVEVTGETYFQVARNASKPFKVLINGKQEVEVLGTSFDINAYEDEEQDRTTLLEGKVKVQGAILKPGDQAQWKGGQAVKVLSDADVEEAVAWKNGKFIFTGDDIGSVMRQIARWYDVDVEYKGDFKGVELVGVIPRNNNVSEILRMLEQTRTVKFTVEGRKITVFPYKK
jgi:transmembrane sensor